MRLASWRLPSEALERAPEPDERDKVTAAFGLTRDQIAWGHKNADPAPLRQWPRLIRVTSRDPPPSNGGDRCRIPLLQLGRLVDFQRVKSGVDHPQQRDNVGVRVADPADFEVILVHIDDLQVVLPDAGLARFGRLGARPLEKLQGSLQTSLGVVVRGKRSIISQDPLKKGRDRRAAVDDGDILPGRSRITLVWIDAQQRVDAASKVGGRMAAISEQTRRSVPWRHQASPAGKPPPASMMLIA